MMSKFIKGSWKRILSAVICILIIMGTCVIPSVVPASAKTFIYDKTYDFANDSGTQYGKVTLKDSSGVDRQISRAHFSINENEKLEILNDLEERSSGPSGFLFNDNEGLFELKEATSYSISLKVKLVSSQKNFVYNGVTYPTSTQITELKLAYGMPATYADNRITMDTEIGLVAEVGNNAQTFTANQNGSEVTLELGEWHTLTYDFTTPDTFGTNGNVLGFALKSFNGVHILVDDVTVTRLTSITVDPGVGTISQTSFIHKIGDKINIENPTYQFGYDFEGWYTDAACTKEFTDQYVTEENCEIKLYAGWSQTHFSFEGYTKVGQYGFNEHFYDIIEAEDAPDGKNVVQYHYTEEYWNQIRSGSVETGDAVYYSARRTQLENNISLKHVESYTTYVITFKYKLEEGSGDVYIAPATGSTNIWHTDVYVEYKDSALTLTSEVPDVWREGRMIFTTGDVSKIPGYYRNVATLRFYALGHTTTVAYLDDVRIEEATGATTVKLNANGGSFKDGSTIKNQETAIGESMFSLTYPYRENYDFAGWCYDEACTQKVESDVVDSSIYLNTLYASWSEGVGFESYYLDTEADDRSNYLSDSVTIEKTDPYMGLYSAKLVNNSSDAQHVIALNPIKNKTRYLVTFHYKLVSADYDISVRFATMNLNVNNTADLKIYDEAYTVKTDEVGKGYITGAVIIESDFANDKANRLAMLIKSEASASYTVYFDQIDVSVLKENEGYVIFADEITGDHKVQIGTVGESIKPFEPSKEAHKFLGWYTDRACTSLYEGGKNYSSVLSKVYAKWAKGESFNDSTLSSSNVSAVVDSNNKQNKYLSFTGSDEVKIATVSSGKKYGVDLRYSLISAEGNTTVTVGNQSYNVSINELGLGWTNLSFVVTADSDVFSLKVEPTNSNILIDDVIVYEITEDMSVITFKQKSGYGDDVVRIGVKGLTVDYPVIVPHGSDVFYGWYIDNTYKTPVTLSNFGGDDLTVYGRWASNPITNITFDDLDTDNPLINENNSNRAYLSNKWKYGTYSLALDRESEEEYEVYAPLANKDGYVRLESNTTYAVHFQFYYSPYTSSAKMHFNFFCASDDSYSNPIAVGEPFTGKHSYNSQYGCTYIKTGELSDSANTLYIAVTGGTKKTTLYIDSIKLTRVDEGRNHIFALDDRDKNKRVYEIDGNYGQPINFPQIDTNNYKVTGWCNDLEVTDMYEEGVHKEEPITFLYARWELNTVNFDNYQFENSNSKYTVGDDISLSREESFDTIRSLKYSYNYAIKYFETSNNVACMGRVNNKSTYRISFYYKLTETQGDVDVKFLTAHLTNRWAFITDYDEATYTIRSGEVGNDWAKATVYLTTEFATIGASGLFFTFNPRVEGDTVLYVDQVNIECIDKTAVAAFVGNEGAAVVYKEGAVGSTVAVPDSASIAQFAAFDGWYSDKELTDKISSVVLSSGVNYVYSKWNENTENFSGYSYASNSADNYSAENKIVNGALNTTVKENIFNGLRLGTINNNTSYKLTFDYKADAAATIKLASADEMSVYENATHYNDQGNYITANADNAWHTETVYFTSSFSYTVPKDEKVNTKDNKNADFGNMLYMYFEGVGANISIDNITLTEVEALYSDGASVLTEEASKEAGSQALRFFFSYKTDDIHTINIGGTDMHVVERGIIFKNARNTATGVIDGNTVKVSPIILANKNQNGYTYVSKSANMNNYWSYNSKTESLVYSAYIKDFGLTDSRLIGARGYIKVKDENGKVYTFYSADKKTTVKEGVELNSEITSTKVHTFAGVTWDKFTIINPKLMPYIYGQQIEYLMKYASDTHKVTLPRFNEKSNETAYEIVIGDTTRSASGLVSVENDNEYVIAVRGTKLIIKGGSDLATMQGVKDFISYLKIKDSLKCGADLKDGYTKYGKISTTADDYALTFNDEFSGSTIDRSKWGPYRSEKYPNVGAPSQYGGDVIFYVPGDPSFTTASGRVVEEPAFTRDGNAVLAAARLNDKDFSFIRMSTYFNMIYQYGMLEFNVKLPEYPAHTSLWMNGASTGSSDFVSRFGREERGCMTEFDLIETYGKKNFFGTCVHHWWSSTGKNDPAHISLGAAYSPEGDDQTYVPDSDETDITSNYHIFTFLWTNDTLEFAFDGVKYCDYPRYYEYYDRMPNYIIIGMGMGDRDYGQKYDIEKHTDYYELLLDYVRLYQVENMGSILNWANGNPNKQ